MMISSKISPLSLSKKYLKIKIVAVIVAHPIVITKINSNLIFPQRVLMIAITMSQKSKNSTLVTIIYFMAPLLSSGLISKAAVHNRVMKTNSQR